LVVDFIYSFTLNSKLYSTLLYSVHTDFDVAPEGETIEESHNNLDVITDYLLEKQKETNINLLWATQNLFSNPRYMNGGMTNPDVQVSIYIILYQKLN
jgi:xylose isomerase